MVTWPTDLPQSPLIAGFGNEEQDAFVRTSMETGVDKIRRRYTGVATPYKWPLILTNTQKTSLSTFYQTSGALSFSMTEPVLQVVKSFRFTKAPAYAPLSHNRWSTILELEMLP